MKRALASAQIPTRLGLSYEDKKRPDSMTLIPWTNDPILSWDETCSDTLAPSYIDLTSWNSGTAAAREQH